MLRDDDPSSRGRVPRARNKNKIDYFGLTSAIISDWISLRGGGGETVLANSRGKEREVPAVDYDLVSLLGSQACFDDDCRELRQEVCFTR